MDSFFGLVALSFFFLFLINFSFFFSAILKIYYFNNLILFYSFFLSFFLSFVLSFSLSFFLSFFLFLPFLLIRVADRVLVLQLGVRLEPLRWENRVQDIGPPETSWPHVISNSKSCPRELHLKTKSQLHSMTSKLQSWTPYAKQLARQEHNPNN